MKRIFCAFAFVVALSFPYGWAQAEESPRPEVGHTWTAGTYCTEEAAAKTLSQAMAKQGIEGFMEIMAMPNVACVHHRLHANIPTPQVKLTEKVWTTELPDGALWEFWTAVDPYGKLGWVWFPVPGQGT